MRSSPQRSLALLATALLLPLPTVLSKAILGIDLGSMYMKVALVQRNSPLEIVTNLHSKRKTEQMILFDNGARFYGADANSLIGRKPLLTPKRLGVMLGRGDEHPCVEAMSSRNTPLIPTYNETRYGTCLQIAGASYTPEELIAMVLNHAKEITAAHSTGTTPLHDCVLTVPSFYTQHERRALLDAADLAGLNVLGLMDENTAAALHFGIDRVDDEPLNVLFYNMGAGATQVSIVTFGSYEKKESKYSKTTKKVGAFEVKGKGWDSTLGGDSFDARIVDFMAEEFNEKWNANRNDGEVKDVRQDPRAVTKLWIQANKAKHILSANNDFPIFIESLKDDTHLQMHLSRAKLDEICHDLFARSDAPINDALEAAGMTLEDINIVELIGGGMRIPAVQAMIQSTLGDKLELGLHMNSDESMALGAAFHGANVSTAFRVRHVGLTDLNPFPIGISLSDLEVESVGLLGNLFGIGKKAKEDADDEKEKEETWGKKATVFKGNGKIGVKKTIAFTHTDDVHCSLDYEEKDVLPTGTELPIEKYNITGIAEFAKEMAEKDLGKPKVSLQFEINGNGLTHLIKAEAAVEEMYTVEEEEEVDDEDDVAAVDEATNATDESSKTTDETETEEKEAVDEAETVEKKDETAEAQEETETPVKSDSEAETPVDGDALKEEESKEGEPEKVTIVTNETNTTAKDKKKKPKKKKKTIMVTKEKKRVHKRTLTVVTYHTANVQPYSPDLKIESKDKLGALDQKDQERQKLEEAKNNLESYIYHIKNKLVDDEDEINAVSTEDQREEISSKANEMEDWLYEDGYDADLATFEGKLDELTGPAEDIFMRQSEAKTRPEAITALNAKLEKVGALMTKWETTHPQITEEDRAGVLTRVEDVRTWVTEVEEKQAATEPFETPAFLSADVPLQTKKIEALIAKLNKKPKPKPVKVKKNETDTNTTEANATEANATEGAATEATEETSEEKVTDEKSEESSTPEADKKEEDLNEDDSEL